MISDGGVSQTGLQRSQSFVDHRSSAPVQDTQLSGHVTRSQSVTDRHKSEHDADNASERTKRSSLTNGHIDENSRDSSKQSQNRRTSREEVKPPIPKSSNRHSSGHSSSVHTDTKISDRQSRHSDKGLRRSESDHFIDRIQQHKESETSLKKGGAASDYLKSKDISKVHIEPVSVSDNKEKEETKREEISRSGRPSGTVLIAEKKRQGSIKERASIFENSGQGDEKDVSDRSRNRTSQVLVSRAGLEKSKQDKLISVRRTRSFSAEPRRSYDRSDEKIKHANDKSSNRERKEEKAKDNRELLESDGNLKNKEKKKEKKSKIDSVDKFIDRKVKSSSNLFADNKDSEDKRVSPSLQWLAEKRKSLTTPNDVDKLLSTLDIEQAFSDILDAVEKFPEDKKAMDTLASADIPILEEEMSESSEMEEEVRPNKPPQMESSQSDTGVEVESITKRIDSTKDVDDEAELVQQGIVGIEKMEKGSAIQMEINTKGR